MITKISDKLKLVVFALGIFFFHTLWAIFQEKLFKTSYNGEKFVYPTAFVVIQCIVYAIIAKGVMFTQKEQHKNETPHKFYLIVALFYILSMVTASSAIQFIPYPVQVVGKSCKPIPIMLLDVLVIKKSYTIQKYFFVLMIVIGVCCFMYKDDFTSKPDENYILGCVLIGVSLLFDGLLGMSQNQMRKVAKPSPLNFMFYVNGYGSLLAMVIFAISNERLEFFKFCMRNHSAVLDLSLAAVMGIFGQFFISCMITHFGSLPLAIVTTTRKFFTILFSIIIFKNTLTLQQWCSTGLIFSALMLDTIFSKKAANVVNDEDVIANVEEGSTQEQVSK